MKYIQTPQSLPWATIYFEGRTIGLNAQSIGTIGSTYYFYSEKDSQGKIVGMFPVDRTAIVINKL